MKKIFKEAYDNAKIVPKGLWITAVIIPGGIATITIYLAAKTIYTSAKKKGNKDANS